MKRGRPVHLLGLSLPSNLKVCLEKISTFSNMIVVISAVIFLFSFLEWLFWMWRRRKLEAKWHGQQ